MNISIASYMKITKYKIFSAFWFTLAHIAYWATLPYMSLDVCESVCVHTPFTDMVMMAAALAPASIRSRMMLLLL